MLYTIASDIGSIARPRMYIISHYLDTVTTLSLPLTLTATIIEF